MKRTETSSETDDFWVVGRRVKFDPKLDKTLKGLGFKEVKVRAYKVIYEGGDRILFIADEGECAVNLWSVPVDPSTDVDDKQMYCGKIFPVEPPSDADVIRTLGQLRMSQSAKKTSGVLEDSTLESPVVDKDS